MKLGETWSDLERSNPAGSGVVRRRVGNPRGRDLYIGIIFPERLRTLSLVVKSECASGQISATSTRCLRLTLEPPSEGVQELRITLLDDDIEDVFNSFAEDVVESVTDSASDAAAVSTLVQRFERWRYLLGGVSEGLGRDAVQGLFGELWVLRHLLWPTFGEEAARAWTGPDHEAVDFQLYQAGIEVKTTSASRPPTVLIQSERQLASDRFPVLLLVGLTLDVLRTGSGHTLNAMVDEVRGVLQDPAVSLDPKLRTARYFDEHRELYERMKFTVRQDYLYRVEDGFPRLTEDDLPAGIGPVRYSLSLDACEHWRIQRDDIGQAIASSSAL